MKKGQFGPLYWYGLHAKKEVIQHEAHQALCWGKSGISFEKLLGRQCEYADYLYLCCASDCERAGRMCGMKEEALKKNEGQRTRT